jgi:protease IV
MTALRRLVRGAIVGGVLAAAVPALAQKVGMLEIKGSPLTRPAELAWLMGSGEPTLRELVEAIRAAGEDDALSPIVIRLKDASLSRTQVEELGAAIKEVRKGGKQVHVFSEGYGPTDLVLGSYADKVLIQSGGPVSLPGMFMEEMYLADTLSWIGVKADLVQVGDYKGANEMFVNSAPSAAWETNINQLLDSLYGVMRDELKAGRKLSDEKLDAAMEKAWMADDAEAVAAGLVDKSVDLPGLGEAVTGKETAKFETIEVGNEGSLAMGSGNPMAEMMAMMKAFTEKPSHKPTEPTIAVVHIDGVIVDGDSSAGGLFGGEGSVGSRTIRNALEEVRDQDLIKGVIVRVDSPGGSATASEVMWQGIKRIAEKKPVWVSVGSLAASGGYYVAVGGDRIYVNPSSVVGSIGVVGGKMSMGGLYDWAKVKVVGRGRGPKADLFDSSKPWNPAQLALVRDKMTRTFDLFTKRVAAGRKGIDLSKTAGGWLFAGQKAIDMKMADKVGGLDLALDDLADHLKLNDYAVMDYPAPRSFPEILEDAFKGFGAKAPASSRALVGAELAATLKEVVGPRAWPAVRAALTGLMLLRDQPVALVMPRAIILR